MGRARRGEGSGRDLLTRPVRPFAAALLAVATAVAPAAGAGVVETKLDSRLRAAAPVLATGGLAAVPQRRTADGRVRVYVRLADTTDATLAALRGAGAEVEIVDTDTMRVQAVVAPERAAALAALPAVLFVRPAERARRATGSVDSEGDAASHADEVRSMLGYDGSGTTVAIISDGIDHLASAQATGDLGTVTVPPDPRCSARDAADPQDEDEGTAILEIVHDLAPGAALLFSSGFQSSLVFIQSVQCLAAAGASVIADDLVFFDEPFFQDGPVAQAVRAAVTAGVSYHTAAGNSALVHVEQPYLKSATSAYHDFGGGDEVHDVVVPPAAELDCVLQWNDAFGQAADDYDLEVYDEATSTLAGASTTMQTGTQDPIEIVSVVNPTGTDRTAGVKILKKAGADKLLDLFCLGGREDVAQDHTTPTGSIVAQAAVAEVVTVAAMDVQGTLTEAEPFSSHGPVTIFFPAPAIRLKPDITGFDGVSTSNAGGFPPGCPPFCSFFGTSAATPHSAAVAALMRSKNPFLSPADVAATLRATAVDVGPVGFDEATGAGRLDAFAAVSAVPVPECLHAATCDDANPCTSDACVGGHCTHTPVSCDDGNACNGVETCDPARGCVPGVAPTCVDADPCTSDTCNPRAGCVFTDLPGIDFLACALASHLAPLLPAPDAASTPRGARLARRLAHRLANAERQVDLARGSAPGRARRRLQAARRMVVAIQRIVRRDQRTLGATVVGPIVVQTRTIALRIRAVLQQL